MTSKKLLLPLAISLIVFGIISFPRNLNKSGPIVKNQQSSQVKGESIQSNEPSVSPKLKTDINADSVKVTRVIDGDTIEISAVGGPATGGEGGQKVRYIGIDTPETVHPTKPVQCFGHEASIKNQQLVEGKLVCLEKDVSETDKYGRLLRYVYLTQEESGQTIFVNDYLVRQGYAHSSSYPPDIKHQDEFNEAQTEARDNNRGLWSSCPLGTNQQSVASSQAQESAGPNGCTIKGNISSKGEKIYHMPGQRYYNKTIIDESRGEKWFCTESDAQKDGFRKSSV